MGEAMRERIARAICREQLGWIATEEEVERFTSRWLKHADAALAAMREPTEAMVEEGAYVLDDDVEGPSTATCTAFRKAWQATIDSARNEQPDEEADVERSS